MIRNRTFACAVLLLWMPVQRVAAAAVELDLVTRTPGGETTAAGSYSPPRGVSADGRYVLLGSAAPDLLDRQVDSNRHVDVFLRDRSTGELMLVSRRAGHSNVTGNSYSHPLAISPNGAHAVFSSSATDLVDEPPGATARSDVFVFDVATRSVRRVTRPVAVAEVGATCYSAHASVSNEGWIAFYSECTDLVATDENYAGDVFLFDPHAGTLSLVSHPRGQPERTALGGGMPAALSADGRHVLFNSPADDIDPDVSNATYTENVYLYDRSTATSTLISRTPTGSAGNAASQAVAMTPDASTVVFSSFATDLTGESDTNEVADAYVFERATGGTTLLSRSREDGGRTADGETRPTGLSDDGRRILLQSTASDLAPPFARSYPEQEAFLLDRALGTVQLVSHRRGESSVPAGGVTPLAISPSGERVLYAAYHAPDVSIDDGNAAMDLVLYDVETGTPTVLSLAAGTRATANGPSESAQFSADASTIVLHSAAANLIPSVADGNNASDAFIYSPDTGALSIAALAEGSTVSTARSYSARGYWLAPDGRRALFGGGGVVAGAFAGPDSHQLFAYDVDARLTSAIPGTRSAAWYSAYPAGASGSVFALTSSIPRMGDTLVEGNHEADVFAYDAGSDAPAQLISRSTSGAGRTANARSFARGIAASGRYVLFDSLASDLVPGVIDVNQMSDIFVFDRDTSTMQLLSSVAGQPMVASGDAESVAISEDGRWVLAKSYRSDLVAGARDEGQHYTNVILIDRESRTAALVSHAHYDPLLTAEGYSAPISMTPDGRWILFSSSAPDLLAGVADGNAKSDVFLYDRDRGTSELISHLPGWPNDTAGGASHGVALTADARFVLFDSSSADLIPGIDLNETMDVFVHDRHRETTVLVSRTSATTMTAPDRWSSGRAISHDGRRVLFNSSGSNLLAIQDANHGDDAFVRDLDLGVTHLLSGSHYRTGFAGNRPSTAVAMSADGTVVLLNSEASDLVPAIDLNNRTDIFVARIDFDVIFASGFEGVATGASASSGR